MKCPIIKLSLAATLLACNTIQQASTALPSAAPPTATATAAVVPSHLEQALALMPETANHVEFTDWALIKKNEGYASLSSTDDLDQRIDFLIAVSEKYAIPSAYGLSYLRNHAELWGWDSTDLDWEVFSSISIHPNFALKFRSDFDLGRVRSHFEEYAFKKTIYQNVPIYSRPIDTSFDLVKTTELSILNTAIIEEQNVLLMSSDRETVLLLIDTLQNRSDSLADKGPVQDLIRSLANTPGAFISGNACSLLGSQALIDWLAHDAMKETKQRELRQQLESLPPLQSYEALGIAYSLEGPEPVGRVVLQFSSPEEALQDLAPRRQLAETGRTRGKNSQPYAETFFSLENAAVQGNQIVMEVKPVHNRVVRLFQMVQTLDMSFATCP